MQLHLNIHKVGKLPEFLGIKELGIVKLMSLGKWQCQVPRGGSGLRLREPKKLSILVVTKKLVAVAYSAKMAYSVSHCLLPYLEILG